MQLYSKQSKNKPEFKQLIADPDLTYEMQNELYKTILECVEYKRTGANGITLNILFK